MHAVEQIHLFITACVWVCDDQFVTTSHPKKPLNEKVNTKLMKFKPINFRGFSFLSCKLVCILFPVTKSMNTINKCIRFIQSDRITVIHTIQNIQYTIQKMYNDWDAQQHQKQRLGHSLQKCLQAIQSVCLAYRHLLLLFRFILITLYRLHFRNLPSHTLTYTHSHTHSQFICSISSAFGALRLQTPSFLGGSWDTINLTEQHSTSVVRPNSHKSRYNRNICHLFAENFI